MDDLVQRLSEGDHPIVFSRGESASALKQSIDRGFVLLKFTDTQGGTELGIRLDNAATHFAEADFSQGVGVAHLAGNLTLNYVRVRCVADVDLATLQGKGHLEILTES